MQTAKIYFSESELDDMQTSFYKGERKLWSTKRSTDASGLQINIEIYVGEEEEIEQDNILMWEYIKLIGWERNSIERCKMILNSFNPKSIKNIKDFVENKVNALKMENIDNVKKDRLCGDDAYHDVCCEVVGRGKEFWEKTNYSVLWRMIKDNDYKENFMYIFNN